MGFAPMQGLQGSPTLEPSPSGTSYRSRPPMPPPLKSAKYPPSYRKAADTALIHGSFHIPCEKPGSMRRYFQEFFRALEREGEPMYNDSLLVQVLPSGITLRERDKTPQVLAIDAALAALPNASPGLLSIDEEANRLLADIMSRAS